MTKEANWLDDYLAKFARNGRRSLAVLTAAAQLAGKPEPKAAPKTYQDKEESFGDAWSLGLAGIITCGKLVADMVDMQPDAHERLMRRYPFLTAKGLITLEQIGRGRLHPSVLGIGDPFVSSRVEQLPMDQQAALIDDKQLVPVVKKCEGGPPRVEHKTLQEMNRSEVIDVIVSGKVLTVDEQVARHKERSKAEAKRERRFELTKSGIHFYADSDFTWSDLLDLVNQHTQASLKTLESDLKKKQVA